jgi:peptide/nickel transport system permease protein
LDPVLKRIRRCAELGWRHRHAVVMALLIGLAILAPVVAPYGPVQRVPAGPLQPPSWRNLFGTDSFGFDVLSRVIYGARVDLLVAVSSVFLGLILGIPLGAAAGYLRGATDMAITRSIQILQAFPQVLFAMIFFAAVGNSSLNLVWALALLNAAFFSRLVRASALPLRDAEFIQAARVTGYSRTSIVFKQIIPNTLTPVFGQFAISAAASVLLVAALSYIGLGFRVPEAEWGSMIQTGTEYLTMGQWWPALFPGLAICLTTWSFAGVGRSIRQVVLR